MCLKNNFKRLMINRLWKEMGGDEGDCAEVLRSVWDFALF
jgi:hypothetical protein